MLRFAAASDRIRLPSTSPWTVSGGAVRKKKSLYPDSVAEVFAGEIMTVSEPTTSSITLSVTWEDAAPMITEAPSLMSSVTDCVATWVFSASEESLCETLTSEPRTPPASLISSTARSTPAISGGPSCEREPVTGSSVPSRRLSPEAPVVAAPVAEGVASSSPSELHAVSTRLTLASSARERMVVVLRFMGSPTLARGTGVRWRGCRRQACGPTYAPGMSELCRLVNWVLSRRHGCVSK
jgi:hypothetical protein